jgi:hypothetical protein
MVYNNQENLKKFFYNIQEGQDLGHHRTKWWAIFSKLIAYFGNLGTTKSAKKSHTSIIVDVDRSRPHIVTFKLLEATKKRGVNISSQRAVVQLDKSKDKYTLLNFHKDEQLYWSDDVVLDNDGLKALERFQNAVVGKRYAKLSSFKKTYVLRFTEWFFKVDIEDIDFAITPLENASRFYCSQLSIRKDYQVGIITATQYQDNPYHDPMSFFKTKKNVLRIK